MRIKKENDNYEAKSKKPIKTVKLTLLIKPSTQKL